MTPVRNARLIFNKRPTGYPVIGETLVVDDSQTIDLDNVSLAGGKVLAKTLAISIDPYLRSKMRDNTGIKGYAFELGQPLYGFGVIKVLRSENPNVKVGAHLYQTYGEKIDFAEYQIIDNLDGFRVLPEDTGLPWHAFLGPVGMPAETAFYGLRELQPKKGQTIYVSTAAGAVGSVLVQLAKEAGLKVIASAGQEYKLEFLRTLGADVVFNYKTTSVDDVLREHGPVDIYWDNVGGETLSTVLNHMNLFGQVFVSGLISGYNTENFAPDLIANFHQTLFKRLTIRGFYVHDYHAKYEDEFYRTFPAKVARGEIKYNYSIVRSLDDAPQLLLDVQKGDNRGKAVVVLAED